MGLGQVRERVETPTRDLFTAPATRDQWKTCPACKGTGDRPEEKP